MNVRDLIERLSELDPDVEVLLATQPSWPMQAELGGVAAATTCWPTAPAPTTTPTPAHLCAPPSVVYLVEATQPTQPYAPRAAWEVAR